MEERRAREQKVAADLLKRFEPQGATMVMVEAALSAAEGSTRIATKMLTAQLATYARDCTHAFMRACMHTRTCAHARTHARTHMYA